MTDLPPITRPDGRVYRPKKVVAHAWGEYGYDLERGAVVLGTHDVERARALAASACASWYGLEHAVRPEVDWFRDGYENGRRAWVRDEVRGRAGVWFVASDEPDEGEPLPVLFVAAFDFRQAEHFAREERLRHGWRYLRYPDELFAARNARVVEAPDWQSSDLSALMRVMAATGTRFVWGPDLDPWRREPETETREGGG